MDYLFKGMDVGSGKTVKAHYILRKGVRNEKLVSRNN